MQVFWGILHYGNRGTMLSKEIGRRVGFGFLGVGLVGDFGVGGGNLVRAWGSWGRGLVIARTRKEQVVIGEMEMEGGGRRLCAIARETTASMGFREIGVVLLEKPMAVFG